MYEHHHVKNGRKLLVCQMNDEHLTNTINLLLRHIAEAKSILDSKGTDSRFRSALVGRNEEMYACAEASIQEITKKLYPYLAEAMLRGISFTKHLQSIYERTEAEVEVGVYLQKAFELLPDAVDDDDLEWSPEEYETD